MQIKRLTPPKNNNKLQGPVTVIDSPMGVGKTTYMINHVRLNKEQPHLIATPYDKEMSRWDDSIEHLERPSTEYKETLLEDLKELLANKKSIITSHKLFTMMDKDCFDLIRQAKYTLIIDETLECISTLNHHSHDIDALIELNKITLTQGIVFEHLEWHDMKYKGNMAKSIKTSILSQEVVVSSGSYFNVMKPQRIKSFTNVYVLTYMFETSKMESYFRLKGIDIPYEKFSVSGNKLVNYRDPMGTSYKELINIHNTGTTNLKRLNKLSKYTLSYSFYNKASASSLKRISTTTRAYFDDFDTDRTLNMYTVFKEWEPKISTHRFKKMEKGSNGKKHNSCFVSLNARATNNYQHKTRLAYLVNRFMNPVTSNLITKYGSSIDNDGYALSELIQWIFRSAIRNNQPISLFIPSKRMRNLLIKWLDGESLETPQK